SSTESESANGPPRSTRGECTASGGSVSRTGGGAWNCPPLQGGGSIGRSLAMPVLSDGSPVVSGGSWRCVCKESGVGVVVESGQTAVSAPNGGGAFVVSGGNPSAAWERLSTEAGVLRCRRATTASTDSGSLTANTS